MPGKAIFCRIGAQFPVVVNIRITALSHGLELQARDDSNQRFVIGSVMRFIASASLGASQRISLVSDIACTIEDATPILVM